MGRSAVLKLFNYITIRLLISTGIPHSSLLSPMLYTFYNADLVELCTTVKSIAAAFIAGVAILVVGHTTEENLATLSQIYHEAEKRATEHGSVIFPSQI